MQTRALKHQNHLQLLFYAVRQAVQGFEYISSKFCKSWDRVTYISSKGRYL
jgi:hypothetical protein